MNRKERRRQKKNTSQNQVNNSLLEAIKLHVKKDFENAENLYLTIIKNDQTNYQALRHLGILYNDTKKYEKAIKYLTDAINIAPSIPDAHNNLGLAFKGLGNLKKATIHFEQAINIEPNNVIYNSRFNKKLFNVRGFSFRDISKKIPLALFKLKSYS